MDTHSIVQAFSTALGRFARQYSESVDSLRAFEIQLHQQALQVALQQTEINELKETIRRMQDQRHTSHEVSKAPVLFERRHGPLSTPPLNFEKNKHDPRPTDHLPCTYATDIHSENAVIGDGRVVMVTRAQRPREFCTPRRTGHEIDNPPRGDEHVFGRSFTDGQTYQRSRRRPASPLPRIPRGPELSPMDLPPIPARPVAGRTPSPRNAHGR